MREIPHRRDEESRRRRGKKKQAKQSGGSKILGFITSLLIACLCGLRRKKKRETQGRERGRSARRRERSRIFGNMSSSSSSPDARVREREREYPPMTVSTGTLPLESEQGFPSPLAPARRGSRREDRRPGPPPDARVQDFADAVAASGSRGRRRSSMPPSRKLSERRSEGMREKAASVKPTSEGFFNARMERRESQRRREERVGGDMNSSPQMRHSNAERCRRRARR